MNKKICLISPKFLGYIGGMETHAFEFAKAFSNDLKYPLESIFIKTHVDDGISAYPNETHDGVKGYNGNKHNFESLIREELTSDFNIDAKIISSGSDPDNTIYFLNSPTWLPALALIKAKYPKTKVIVRSGGNDIVAGWSGSEADRDKNIYEIRKYLVELVNDYTDRFIVNSNYSKRRTLEVGVRPEKIVKVKGGVDCSSFYPNPTTNGNNHINILTVARLVKFKGFEHSLLAINELIRGNGTKIHYLIAGDGPEKEHLKDIVKKMNLEKDITFLGARPVYMMPEIYRMGDIFLHMPIYWERNERGGMYIHTETMGRGLCEALGTGLPVVASNVGGVPEMIEDKVSGFIVPEKDYILSSEKLNLLINNEKLRKNMGREARERATKNFDWKILFEKYKKIFMDQ